jgi:hypothetical protein
LTSVHAVVAVGCDPSCSQAGRSAPFTASRPTCCEARAPGLPARGRPARACSSLRSLAIAYASAVSSSRPRCAQRAQRAEDEVRRPPHVCARRRGRHRQVRAEKSACRGWQSSYGPASRARIKRTAPQPSRSSHGGHGGRLPRGGPAAPVVRASAPSSSRMMMMAIRRGAGGDNDLMCTLPTGAHRPRLT